ncbi:9db19d96-e099-4d47-ab34-65506077d333 [Thermothielavioides terrestris]|uniref:9db19d96-e099-4d47-ab34-65506077d333 n=1 Tax=Thermothielavioides terrestris TaxID=2587410 RepID=A0A446B8M8_9PEZI|nr:9db19d96-e099-4d47-ab34-65506077d333 [Thermothielavioides terrestris]
MRRWKKAFNAGQQEESARRAAEAAETRRYLAQSADWRRAQRRHYHEVRSDRSGNPSLAQFLRAEEEAEARRRARAEFLRQTEDAIRAVVAARRSDEARLESALAEESRLRAAWEAARATRTALEAKIESALAEERRLKGLLGESPAEEPEPSSKGREKAAGPAQEPEPSSKGKEKAGNDVAQEPETARSAPAQEPEKADAAATQEPESSLKRRVKVVRFAVPEEPESPLERRVKEDNAAAQEPETPLEGRVKVVRFAVPEEPESPLERKVKEDQEETQEPETAGLTPAQEPETVESPSLAEEPTPEVEQDEVKDGADSIAEEPELPLEGRVKADHEMAEPEGSLTGMAEADSQGTQEPELKASYEEEAMVKVAQTPAGQSETEASYEEEEMMTAAQPLAEEPEKVGQAGPAEEPEKAEERLAEEPVKVGHTVFAEELEKVEEELVEELVKVGFMDAAEGPEKTEQAVAEEPEPVAEQGMEKAADPMELDPAEAEVHAEGFAFLQGAEAQRRAEEEEERAMALALQAALEEHAREEAEAARRASEERAWLEREQALLEEARRREEESERALQAAFAARLRADEEHRAAAQAAAETAYAEEVSMLDAPDSGPNAEAENAQDPDAGVSKSDRADEDSEISSLNSEDFAWLNALIPQGTQEQDATPAEGRVEAATQGTQEAVPQSAPAEEAKPTGSAEASRDDGAPPLVLTFGQVKPETTAVTVPQTEFVFRADFSGTAPRLQADAAEAKSAPADAAKQQKAGPAIPAGRKVLRARGAKGSAEARRKAALELQALQARPKLEDLEELTEENAAWVAEVEEAWLAELQADSGADSKGKEKAKSGPEARAEVRTRLALEFQAIEEARQRSESAYLSGVELFQGRETTFREAKYDEEALFDPRAATARREAEIAFAMSKAAEEARRSAAAIAPPEEEEEVSEEE